MKEINIPAQIVMVLAFVVMTSSFWCKKRENILKLQVVSSILFVLQYLLLHAYTGALLNTFSIARAFIFRKKTEKTDDTKNKGINWSSNWILYIFLIVFVLSSVVTWDGIVSIYALMATLVYTVGMWADKPQYIRMSSNVASVFWFAYNYSTGGYAGCVTECILFTSNTVAIVKNRGKKDNGAVASEIESKEDALDKDINDSNNYYDNIENKNVDKNEIVDKYKKADKKEKVDKNKDKKLSKKLEKKIEKKIEKKLDKIIDEKLDKKIEDKLSKKDKHNKNKNNKKKSKKKGKK